MANIARVISFDGYDLVQGGKISATIEGWGGEMSRSNNFRDRAGGQTVFSGARSNTRTFTIGIEVNGIDAAESEALSRTIMGLFFDNYRYHEERILEIEDGTPSGGDDRRFIA